MLRYLSAIGLSEYISQKKFNEFLHRCTKDPRLHATSLETNNSDELLVEASVEMDTFALVLGGIKIGELIRFTGALPAVRTFRNQMNLNFWSAERLQSDYPVITGDDVHFGSPVEILLGRVHRLLRDQSKLPPTINVGLCGLSASGQILLGIVRTPEDDAAYKEEEEWRRSVARRIQSGDPHAKDLLEGDVSAMEDEVCSRLKNEDVFTILEGMLIPGDKFTLGYYRILGTIQKIHKILNPYSEEWVYEFELDVMGTPYNVYINPLDLEGVPAVGLRFYGTLYLIGEILWDDMQLLS